MCCFGGGGWNVDPRGQSNAYFTWHMFSFTSVEISAFCDSQVLINTLCYRNNILAPPIMPFRKFKYYFQFYFLERPDISHDW